jgi:ClpP class serine protease
MNILNIHSPKNELIDELVQLDAQILKAAKQGDTSEMKRLGQRKKELPDLIREEHLRELSDRINAQRSRVGVFKKEFGDASQRARELTEVLAPKITRLNQEINRLRGEAVDAQALKQSLQFSVEHEGQELARLQRMKENFLVNQIAEITK